MAQVLAHAPPPKASLLAVKPAAPTVAKAGPHVAEAVRETAKPKFQTLLEQAALAGKVTESQGNEKAKLPKAKAAEVHAEKPKEARRHEAPGSSGETNSNVWAALTHQPKTESPAKAIKTNEGEPSLLSADRNRGARGERRMPGEAGNPGAANLLGQEIPRTASGPLSHRGERNEDKPKVVFFDRRTEAKEKEKLKLTGAEASATVPVNASAELPHLPKQADSKAATNEIQVAFQVSAGKGKEGFDLTPHAGQVPARDAASFQQYLVEKGYGQLVDQARIVLKDQNAGEIRMTLYPESLGKVKVSLNLSENSLAGQIFVENQTVKDVFQSNMDGLLQAFRDGGWNDLSLQVSVGGESGAGTHNQQPETAPQARDYGRQVSQTTLVEGRTDRIGSWNDRQVNLTA